MQNAAMGTNLLRLDRLLVARGACPFSYLLVFHPLIPLEGVRVAAAKSGDTVRVHYKGTLTDGTPFDSSPEGEPFEFTIGSKSVIPGFQEAIIGMAEGDTKVISIPPEEAYGPHTEDAIVVMKRSQLPPKPDPKPGMTLKGESPNGPITFVVLSVEGDEVKLDGNHPLAGKELRFELTVVSVGTASAY